MRTGIVLGYGLFEETNQEYKDYLNWVADQIDQENIERLILCGGITNSQKPVSEAETISAYLKKLKPEFDNLILEDQSLTTNQNLENAVQKLDLSDEIIVFCDLIRVAKVIWLSLYFFLQLDRKEIVRIIFNFAKEQQLKPFVYQTLTVKGFDFPSRNKYLATAQSFSALLEVEALYDKGLDELILENRRKAFGV